MKPKSRLQSLLFGGTTVLAAIIATQSAFATDGTWIIGSSNGNWSDPARWLGGIIADGAGSTADLRTDFNGGRRITIDTTSRTVGTLLTGDTGPLYYGLDLRGSGVVTLTFDNSGSAAQFTTLSTNDVSSLVRDTLPIKLNDSLNIDNAAGVVLNVQGTVTATSAGTKTISNLSTGTGEVRFSGVISDGSGTIKILQNSATAPMLISGANTYTGGNTVSAGRLTLSNSSAVAGGLTTVNGGTIVFSTLTSLYGNDNTKWTPANITVESGATIALNTTGFGAADVDLFLNSGHMGASTGSTGMKPGSILGFESTADASLSSNLTDLSGGNVLNVSKIGGSTLTLTGTNTYTGTTTALEGVLLPSTAASLPGYNSPAKVIFNGGTIAVADVGGAGWSTAEVDTLLSNATKTGGALGIDTSAGDLTQWAAFSAGTFGPLGLTKVGGNTLTLDQANTYTGPTTVVAGTLGLSNAAAIGSSSGLFVNGGAVVLNNATTLKALTFAGATDRTVSGTTLNFPGDGSGTIINSVSNTKHVITSAITGSPSVKIADGATYEGLTFAPTSGTVTLGTCTVPFENLVSDKAGIHLAGTTTGNSVSEILYEGTNQYGTVYKDDSGTWSTGNITTGTVRISAGTLIVNGTITTLYQGLIMTGGKLAGNATVFKNDRRSSNDFLSGTTIAPGASVGTISFDWGTSGGTPAAPQWTTAFRAGSTYEWEIGAANATDVVNIVDGRLIVEGFTLKIINSGGNPAAPDQLPVFTYGTLDSKTLDLASVVLDTTGAPGWDASGASLVDNGSGTIYLTGLVGAGGGPTYASWSGGAAADADANGDGVSNGAAWALGSADVNANAIGLLPTLDNTDPTYVIFNFNRSDDAEADSTTAITVQYGSDLVGWTAAVHDGTDVIITESPGSPTDGVQVKLKRSTLGAGGKLFARLNVVITP